MKTKKLSYIHSFLIIALVISIQSCIPHKKLKLVSIPENSLDTITYSNKYKVKQIRPYDNLYIKVFSTDERSQSIFAEGSTSIANVDPRLISYAVNDSGYLNFPFIGQIYLNELTLLQAQEVLEAKLKRYLNNISVSVRFVGNAITVLGEVNRPGEYVFYDDKISCFQALGLAGGVADYGNLTNVTLLREVDNTLKFYNLDLTRKDVVEASTYYLLPNDVIMIEPIKAKYSRLRNYSSLSIILSSLTTVGLLISSYVSYTNLSNQ
jgi:polysaccharide biosynthesis/export protein